MLKKDFISYLIFILGTFALLFCIIANIVADNQKTLAAIDEAKKSAVSEISEKINNAVSEITSAVEKSALDLSSSITKETVTSEDFDTDSENTIAANKTQNKSIGEEVALPLLSTEPKLFTDYRSYNLWYTPHYRLQQAAYTDNDGLRRFGDDYIVGLGKYYSESVGDRFQVVLDTGIEFTIIFGDGKAPCDCDENNMYTPCVNYDGENCANILEFIVDTDAMPSKVYAYGSIDCLDKFKGNIVKMVYLGRDNSADWDTYETR